MGCRSVAGGVVSTWLTVALLASPVHAQTAPPPSPTAGAPPPVTDPAPLPAPPSPAPAPVTPPPPAAAPSPAAPAPAAPFTCTPACRSGFLCLQGQCVSACNPPCAAGETCAESGECLRPPPPPNVTIVQGPVGPPPDPGWASGAGVFGIVAGLGVIGLAVGSEMTKDEQMPSLPLGIAATGLTAIAGPITGIGGSSARGSAGVTGAPGLRIAGWLGYALMLLDASVLIGLGVAEIEPPDGVILSVGLLGGSSLACLASDAFISAAQAKDALAAAPRSASHFKLTPSVVWTRAPDGSLVPSLGARGTF
jgi:hypothetical protein